MSRRASRSGIRKGTGKDSDQPGTPQSARPQGSSNRHPHGRRQSASSSSYYATLTRRVASPPQSPSLRNSDVNLVSSPLSATVDSTGSRQLDSLGSVSAAAAAAPEDDAVASGAAKAAAGEEVALGDDAAVKLQPFPAPLAGLPAAVAASLTGLESVESYVVSNGVVDRENLINAMLSCAEIIVDALERYPDMTDGVWTSIRKILSDKRDRDKQARNPRPDSPVCAEKPVATVNCYGEEFLDPYSWLTDKENVEVLRYIEAENAYTEQCTASTKPLQKILNNEFVSRLDESEESARVTLSDGYTYYSRKIPGQEYRIHCRMNQQGNNEVYLDENELARSETFANASFFRLGFVRHSPDCSVIAYGVDSSGNERYTAYFLNLATKQLLPDKICDVYEQFEFSNDGKYVFYLLVDEFERASSFWRHELTFGGDSGGAHAAGGNATNDEEDVLLYEEKDEMYCLTLTKTCNGRFLLLNSAAQITSETRLISADRPLDLPLVLFPRREKIQYTVESHRRFLYVLTNEESKNNWLFRVPFPQADDAEMYEMMLKAPHAGHLLGDNYRETVIPHRDFVLIEDFQVRARHLIVFERSNCLQNVRVVDLTNADSQSAPPSPLPPAYEDAAAAAPSHPARPAPSVQMGLFDSYHYVSFSEVVYSLWPVSTNEEVADLSKSVLFDTNLLRYTYTSFIQPKQVIDYNMDTRTSTVVHEEQVSGSPPYDKSQYTSKRLFATGIDGTAVPISIVYKKDLLGFGRDLPNPLLLHGYGAYGYCINPIFSSTRLSLLDRGFIYAIGHIRGGADMGNAWYEDGKLAKKANTFLDFISCAEYLVKEGYTSPDKLAAYGRSAGGLLMGAVLNMRPDLFRAVLTEVPFLDVINTMFDSSIPWTAFEYEEWGNPATDRHIYEVMKTYCPYTNICLQDYPDTLVIGGMNDPRVAFFEPLKFVAKLRKFKRLQLESKRAAQAASFARGPETGGGEAGPATACEEEDTLLLLKMDYAGHGGNSGQYSYLEDLAFEYAFLVSMLKAPVRPVRDVSLLAASNGAAEEEVSEEETEASPAPLSTIQSFRKRFSGVFGGGSGSEYRSVGKKGDRAQPRLSQWLKNWM